VAEGPFDSAWLKWAWAVVNANVLGDNINAFAAQPNLKMPVRLAHEYDAKRHCIIVRVDEVANPFPPLWGLLLGDAVHNFRSSLDHLAWALYKRGRTPNLSRKKERDVQFPICTDRLGFNGSLKRRLPGVRRTDIALVRGSQPYMYGKRNLTRHVFLALRKLSNADKHRTIQPIIAVPENATYTLGKPEDCVFRRLAAPKARFKLEPGAELARLYVKKTGPEPYIDVDPHFTIDPAINERLLVGEFLKRTMGFSRHLLLAFAKPPESVRAILGEALAQDHLNQQ
jgi:hypothetical protein